MNITVSPKLTELISTIEARELAEQPKAQFGWCFFSSGDGAIGRVFINWAYKEFDISVSENFDAVSVNVRELGKYDDEGWGTDPLDSDYEADDYCDCLDCSDTPIDQRPAPIGKE